MEIPFGSVSRSSAVFFWSAESLVFVPISVPVFVPFCAEKAFILSFCGTFVPLFRDPSSEVRGPLVGPERFELSTSCTPCKRATRLRYGPTRGRGRKPHGLVRRKRFFRLFAER